MSGEFLHFDYLTPKTIREACSLLSGYKGKANAVVMGSDWPMLKLPPQPTHKHWFDAIRNLRVPGQCLQLGLGIRDFSSGKRQDSGENARELLKI